MRKRYIAVGNTWVEVDKDYIPEPKGHFVMNDIQPYQSMIDGSMITSRSHHRAHLKAHNCIEIGNEKQTPKPLNLSPAGLKEDIAREVYRKLRY